MNDEMMYVCSDLGGTQSGRKSNKVLGRREYEYGWVSATASISHGGPRSSCCVCPMSAIRSQMGLRDGMGGCRW